jgi:hypothetical protein
MAAGGAVLLAGCEFSSEPLYGMIVPGPFGDGGDAPDAADDAEAGPKDASGDADG